MESTLVILVPEAEGLVQAFRDRYHPAAKVGMPAHITLLYPFKSSDKIDGLVLDTLNQCFSRFRPFKFSLMTINQFPGETLFLVPEPEDPFRELTLGIWRCYPETPPYCGRYSTIIPHLTVADHMGEQGLGEVAHEFEQASHGCLPIQTERTTCSVAGPLRAAWLRPKQTDLVPDKGQFGSRFHHPLSYCCPTTIFLDTRNRHDIISAQHFWTGGLGPVPSR